MTTELRTELQAFHRFLDQKLKDGKTELSPEESVAAFRAYQRDLERLRRDIQPALDQIARGEARPIDFDEFIRKGRERLAEEGITD
ncbi:MAG: hypothetical protein ACREJB_16535 [Planctomycetaceae bacterium]